jgi:hypothetical protein
VKITAFQDIYPTNLATGVTVIGGSSGSNSGYTGGDVQGTPGDLSVVGLRSVVSLSSNLASGRSVGDVLTLIQTAPSAVAQFATPSNSGGASAGSNSTRVSETSSSGASTTLFSPFDHRHDGIGTITASSSNTMQRGTFNLRPGSNVSFGLSDSDGSGELDTLTINAAATGGSGITVQDEGSTLSTSATTLNFVGSGVTATGTGATKTITVSGGGTSTPTFVQGKGSAALNTTNPTLTLDSTPTNGNRILLGLNLVGRASTGVTQTNVTWTKVFGTSTSAGGSRYEVWCGVVAASAGTTITVSTGSSNFASLVAIEITDALTPTAGTSVDANYTTNSLGFPGKLNGITSGRLVAGIIGCDNTTNAIVLVVNVPHVWYSQPANGTGTAIFACYAPSSGSIEPFFSNASSSGNYALFGEIT